VGKESNVEPCYQPKLFIAIVSFLLGVVGSFAGQWWQKRLEMTAVAYSLKVAFRGEIGAIRSGLGADTRVAMQAWEEGKTLADYGVVYPRTIYEAHAKGLGDLRDSTLTWRIAELYSTLDRAREAGRRLAATSSTEQFTLYVRLLLRCFYMSVLLDMRLMEQTKEMVELVNVTVSERDAADRNFAVDALQKIESNKAR
jgi:hypothetical protein